MAPSAVEQTSEQHAGRRGKTAATSRSAATRSPQVQRNIAARQGARHCDGARRRDGGGDAPAFRRMRSASAAPGFLSAAALAARCSDDCPAAMRTPMMPFVTALTSAPNSSSAATALGYASPAARCNA
jgi:hypothetical protein